MERRIETVETKKAQLSERLAELVPLDVTRRSQDFLDIDPQAMRLSEESHRYKAELAKLQQELQSLYACERSSESGSQVQSEIREQLHQMYEDLDEFAALRADEKVRSESELRELRAERDSFAEQLADARTELRRAQVQVCTLHELGGTTPTGQLTPSGGQHVPLDETVLSNRLTEKDNGALQKELYTLQRCEIEKRQHIAACEKEQDQLVEQMSKISEAQLSPHALPLGPSCLEVRATELETRIQEMDVDLASTNTQCRELRDDILRLRAKVKAMEAKVATRRRA